MGNKIIRLGDYCDIVKGSTGIKKAISGEFPLVVTAEDRLKHNEYQFDTTAVIIPLVSSTGHGHASIKRLHYQEGKFALGTILCAVLIKDTTIINPRFLYLYLSYFKDHLLVPLMKGAANVTLSIKKIKDVEIILPSLQRQLEIIDLESNSDLIDELSFEIETQKKLIIKLKKAILQEAIKGELTQEWRKQNPNIEPASELLERIKAEKEQLIRNKEIRKEKPLPPISEDEIPFELPENWVWCRLGEITNYGSSEKIESVDIKDDTWVLDLEDIEKESSKIIQRKSFKERPSLSTKSIFKNGWVLYSKLRPYLDKVVVVDKEGVCTTEILPLPVYSNLVAKFMMYGMKGKHFINYVNSKVSGMKMPRLKTPDGKMALISLAPVKEQKAIVEKVETLLQKCNTLEQEIIQSEIHANMLMQAVLKEAFGSKTEQETKVVKLNTKPTNIDYYKRTLLATEIVWQLHKEPTLGHLKLQKLMYLAQESGKMQLPTNFLQQVAGPYDPQMARSLDKQMKTKKWFEFKRGEFLKFKPLEKAGEHKADFKKFFANEMDSIQYIIDTFKTAKSDQVEIVGTLCACWNKLIDEKQIISDELLTKRFYGWSEEKAKFEKSRIIKALRWMETKGIVPEYANA